MNAEVSQSEAMAKMKSAGSRISRRKVIYLVVSVLVAIFFSWKFQPQYHSSNAVSVLVTVFSILAGVLIAVMAIVANDRGLRGNNWRQDTYYLQHIRRDLQKYALLFYLYLLILMLAVLASLSLEWPNVVQVVVERFLLFVTSLAMLLSFSLPGQLMQRHISDLERTIRERQEQQIENMN